MKAKSTPFYRHSTVRVTSTAVMILCDLLYPLQRVGAADILRPTSASGTGTTGTASTGSVAPASVPTGGTTRDSLARTALAIQDARSLQITAQQIAKAQTESRANTNPSGKNTILPTVPDGLGEGGLDAISGSWSGAETPTQTTTSGGTVAVTIKQTAQSALLNWKTFNVGKNTALTFDQSAGGENKSEWIAYNIVNDPNSNPTQILGSIKADGQVYIINKNGIVFGGSSQVNTHTLVASALPINSNLIANGLLNNPDGQFLFSALDQIAGANSSAVSSGVGADERVGDVVVEAGAQLSAPTTSAHVGGRIALIGANVTNAGTISTPDGQTILAAGLQVGLVAHDSTDASLRGLDPYIGAVTNPASTLTAYAGTVTNSGIIDSARANITLAGKTIQQNGIINSSTSVSYNGRIDINASYNAIANIGSNSSTQLFLNQTTGNVTFGEGSVTQILPEWSSTEKVVGTELALNSTINVTGANVHFDDDAILYAPSADVNINAGQWLLIAATASGSTPTYKFVNTNGRIDVDSGAVLDVSGSKDVVASVTSNIVAVKLTGTELADNPLNKDGALRGQTIYVDITKSGTYNGESWIGTPLADVSGYIALVERSVGELTAAGGTLNLNAGGAVVIRNNATLDVSGGWVNYQSGVVTTSRVVTASGQIYDIADATPDKIYTGIYDGKNTTTSVKWGTSTTSDTPLATNGSYLQQGYTQGANGGALNITSAAVALDGKLAGSTYTGERQRTNQPTQASLQIALYGQRIISGVAYNVSPNTTTVKFTSSGYDSLLSDFVSTSDYTESLSAERLNTLILSSSLVGEGAFGSIKIVNPNGDVVVDAGETVDAGAGGSISLSGSNLAINGSLKAAGGSIALTAYGLSPDTAVDLSVASSASLPTYDSSRGNITVSSGSVISTAGLIIDDRVGSSTAGVQPIVVKGGSVSMNGSSVSLAEGSTVDVSGGVRANPNGKMTYGNAGSISILTGQDVTASSILGGGISLNGSLLGMSGATGGSLIVKALTIQVGGESSTAALHLDEDFFDHGGFSSFALTGIGQANGAGMLIKAGTVIDPTVSSWLASGTAGSLTLSSYVKEEGLRSPVSLSFAASGAINSFESSKLIYRGDVVVEEGAIVDAGAKGSISLKGDTIALGGSLFAHGGSIALAGASHLPLENNQVTTAEAATVWISSSAKIDASGEVLLVPDSYGRKRGAVLAGGSISVSGNIIADSGAVIDVSGVSGTLDLLAGESGQSLDDLANGTSGTTTKPVSIRGKRTLVESAGGSITLKGSSMLLSDATLLGKSGGSSAAGGSLAVSSGKFYTLAGDNNPFDANLVVKQSGDVIPSSMQTGIGAHAIDDGTGVVAGGRFSLDHFTEGGFSNLTLGGTVKFSGDVSIDAAGSVVVSTNPAVYADGKVSINASYVQLGADSTLPMTDEEKANFAFKKVESGQTEIATQAPTYGAASLSISADLIDVGYLSTQGIGKVNLTAANGDIRGNGTLAVAGDITLTAGQIYTPSALSFVVSASDYTVGGSTHSGSITIQRSGTRSLPLSAGGEIGIYASNILQNGVIRAPFGSIHLGLNSADAATKDVLTGTTYTATKNLTIGADSVTSVSAIDPITGKATTIPYGVSLDGETWLDPAGNDITSGGLPQKSIMLSSENVTTQAGSLIDIEGGGDLMAYRFVSGTGGTTDILGSSGSFAVIPSYTAEYAPNGSFGANSSLGGDTGYTNSSLKVGDRVYLDASSGLPAGFYTLLPARYALLDGAYLVTPLNTSSLGAATKPDGASVVSGYKTSSMVSGLTAPAVKTKFEVASAKIVASRAEYTKFKASDFYDASSSYRLPGDSGQLILQATQSMALQGQIASQASKGYRGGLVDISSSGNILISDGSATATSGTLVLDSSLLSSFGAESLLIGGVRSFADDGVHVSVASSNVTVDNNGEALEGTEIILAAKTGVEVKSGSIIKQTGKLSGSADSLVIGSSGTSGSGNGSLIRLSSGSDVEILRQGVVTGGTPFLKIGANTTLSADSLTLDTTAIASIDKSSTLTTNYLTVSSGRVSLQLDDSVTASSDAGLILASSTIEELASAKALSINSYSTIDLLGAGQVGTKNSSGVASIENLSLQASEIRSYGLNGGQVVFNTKQLTLGNLAGGTSTSSVSNSGTLVFNADTISLSKGALSIKGVANTQLNAQKSIATIADGSFSTTGNLLLNAPAIVGGTTKTYAINSGGNLTYTNLTGNAASSAITSGLGSALTLKGSTVNVNSQIYMPSGSVTLQATSGDLTVNSKVDASGTATRISKGVSYTNGGSISLIADTGNVILGADGSLNVSAKAAAGDAGSLAISAKNGSVSLLGSILGTANTSENQGSFSLDIYSLPSTSSWDSLLNGTGFTHSRTYRVRTGDVLINGLADANSYSLSTDAGSITLSGTIDASGTTGGDVRLVADRGLTLLSGSKIDASGEKFDSASKGGTVTLETRGTSNGVLQLNQGSTIDLSVDEAAGLGDFSGTLHLRAPRIGTTEIAVGTLNSSVLGASAIIVEGYKVYDLTSSGGIITTTVRSSVKSDATTYIGNATSMESRILASNSGLGSILTIRPGAEIVNTSGDLYLGGNTTSNVATTSGSTGDWDLSSYRFGTEQVPGILTLRAAGDLVLYNSLSDGFASSAYSAALLSNNLNLSDNAEAWSFRLVAGADFSGSDTRNVIKRTAASTLGATNGSLRLGKNAGSASTTSTTATYLSSTSTTSPYQVIRTGSGDIDIVTGGDIQFRNAIASIYTAGTLAQNQTLGGTFAVPSGSLYMNAASNLGTTATTTSIAPVQYTLGGGDVSLDAGTDIIHLTLSGSTLIQDSSREMPTNWLYRRGYVDPTTGNFGVSGKINTKTGDVSSTTWWVDFTNFFEGVGALGGGNVTLTAGRDVSNVDAVIPTNARMPSGKPNAAALVELGGGDLIVKSGRNIDGGVYYVESGKGTIHAGGAITTNWTRSPSLTNLSTSPVTYDSHTWLPTTFFVGDAQLDITANGDLLMGPVVNAFLMPQGLANSYWNKTYFSTYSQDSSVSVQSLGGDVTVRNAVTSTSDSSTVVSSLQAWYSNVLLYKSGSTASSFQPWLRLVEDDVTSFSSFFTLMPGSLTVAACSGDVNLVGSMTLSPSASGSLEILAKGAVDGTQITGSYKLSGNNVNVWSSAQLNVSDANPDSIYGVSTPLAYQSLVGTSAANASRSVISRSGLASLFSYVTTALTETGATSGTTLANQQALHDSTLLHLGDEDPIKIYTDSGDISGLTLFSPKLIEILAGNDIRDISFYFQNLSSTDTSIVAAGRDIIAYDTTIDGLVQANSTGNTLSGHIASPLGDIQISGGGTLQILAGRNLDLGTGSARSNGTSAGITSVGNARNPYLQFSGADILTAVGIGNAVSLSDSKADFSSFIEKYVTSDAGTRYLKEIGITLDDFNKITDPEEQKRVALEVFFVVLRDAGRDYNDSTSANYGLYTAGEDAVATLFPGTKWDGDLNTRSRDIRTKNGGDISIIAPGGSVKLAQKLDSSVLVPPGIVTEYGGNISIFTDQDVNIGVARIFTLRGGNEILWSSNGSIAAGSASKTVQAAPPTRVTIDAQSANVRTDLAGLATGGGIGVLTSVSGVDASNVDLIAPKGTIDAGDAGIRVSGNLNIAAAVVLNASNISAGGVTTGAPATAVSAPSMGSLSAANSANAAATTTQSAANAARSDSAQESQIVADSLISVEVIGYGGDDDDDDQGSVP